MIRSNFETLIKSILDQSNTSVTATNLKNAINLAMADLSSTEEFPTLETNQNYTIVAGTASYNLPDDFLKQKSFGLTVAKKQLEWKKWEEFQRYALQDTDQNTPQIFSFWQNKIWLYPIPDAGDTALLNYLRIPADTDELGELKIEVLKNAVLKDLFVYGTPQAQDALNRFKTSRSRPRERVAQEPTEMLGSLYRRQRIQDLNNQ